MVIFTSKILAVSSILALATLTSVTASADVHKYSSYAPNFESTKTREQVREEYFQALKAGLLERKDGKLGVAIDADAPGIVNIASTKTRDQVHDEALQAMKAGGLPKPGDTEVDAEAPALAKAEPSNVQRQDVYAETIEWMRINSGDIGMGD
jgi:Domain of unknown function (DUF4148)